MLFTTTTLLATLASLSLASPLEVRASSCSKPAGTPFYITAAINGKEEFGVLGGPCKNGQCGVFFSVSNSSQVSTQYAIRNTNQLVIAANSPSNSVGFLAYLNVAHEGVQKTIYPNPVEFGRKNFIRSKPSYNPLTCAINPSSSGDGTCDLVCTAHRGNLTTQGQFALTTQSNQWFLGTVAGASQDVNITTKVAYVE